MLKLLYLPSANGPTLKGKNLLLIKFFPLRVFPFSEWTSYAGMQIKKSQEVVYLVNSGKTGCVQKCKVVKPYSGCVQKCKVIANVLKGPST